MLTLLVNSYFVIITTCIICIPNLSYNLKIKFFVKMLCSFQCRNPFFLDTEFYLIPKNIVTLGKKT